MLLIGGLIALQGSALGHEHSELSDSPGCPCVHAEKVEWHVLVASFAGGSESTLSDFVAADVPLSPSLSFLPVRARSPPIA